MFKLLKVAVALSAVAGLAACGNGQDTTTEMPAAEPQEPAMATIEGNVMYRERMMLPPGAVVNVQLQDISKADAAAEVISEVEMTPEGGPPFPFVLEYDPASIQNNMRYALRATISVEGQLMFTTTDYIDPFGSNAGNIIVRRVPSSANNDGPTLEDTTWLLATLAGEPAPLGAGENPVSLLFNATEMNVSGFSGCNQYTGGYAREGMSQHGTPISLGEIAVTKRACMDGMEIEAAYLAALATVNAFRFEDGGLSLLTGGEVLATFTAQE